MMKGSSFMAAQREPRGSEHEVMYISGAAEIPVSTRYELIITSPSTVDQTCRFPSVRLSSYVRFTSDCYVR